MATNLPLTNTSAAKHGTPIPSFFVTPQQTDDLTQASPLASQYIATLQQNEQQQTINTLKSLIDSKHYPSVLEIIHAININNYPENWQHQLYLYQAQGLLMLGNTKKAKAILEQIDANLLPESDQATYLSLLADCHYRNNLPLHSAIDLIALSEKTPVDNALLWSRLQLSNLHFLHIYERKTLTDQQSAWISLAAISKRYSNQTEQLVKQLQNWQQQHPNIHPKALLRFKKEPHLSQQHTRIAIILPLSGKYKSLGTAVQNGMTYAYYSDNNLTNKVELRFYDSMNNDSMKSLYKKILRDKNTLIIGPLTKQKVAELADTTSPKIPVLTLNYLTEPRYHDKLYQFGLSPLDEAHQASIMAWRKGHKNALIIAPNNIKGKALANQFEQQWTQLGGNITDHYFFQNDSTKFSTELSEVLHINKSKHRQALLQKTLGERATFSAREREDFDVIFFAGNTSQGKQIKPLLKFYYVNQPVYAIANINETAGASKEKDLNGIVFCDMPWVITPNKAMKKSQSQLEKTWHDTKATNRLYALGIDSLHLAQELNRFTQLPLLPYQGNTGEIYLSLDTHQFYRGLPCARFSYGDIRSFT